MAKLTLGGWKRSHHLRSKGKDSMPTAYEILGLIVAVGVISLVADSLDSSNAVVTIV